MDGRVREMMRAACGATGCAPWEAAVGVVSSLLSAPVGRGHDARLLLSAAGECMRLCIAHQKPVEALGVYDLLSRSGHTGSLTVSAGRKFEAHTLRGLSVDELALVALQQRPHRAHQRMIVAQLIAAESQDTNDGPSSHINSSSSMESAFPFSVPTLFSGIPTMSPPAPAVLTAAEEFRLQLQQDTQLLRTTRRMDQRLGLQYMLSQMRRVADDARLAAEVEVEPLVCIGRAVLRHPLVHTKPSTEAARGRLLFEDVGSGRGSGDGNSDGDGAVGPAGLSEARRARLAGLETAVDPLRPLCRAPLRFMEALAAPWDALFVRRVAETLVLPDEAHNVIPRDAGGQARRATRRPLPLLSSSSTPLSSSSTPLSSSSSLSASPWTDPSCELFGSATTVHDAMGRAEFLLHRRRHHNMVVPDTPFLLRRFGQLMQLARHREVVVPHTVLLDVVRAALDDQGPRRFLARRVLLQLLYSTTCFAPPRAEPTWRGPGGVTLLGLQDEVALLEGCGARLFLADALGPSAGPGVASVLIAKRLEAFIAAPRGTEAGAGAVLTECSSEVDSLVAGIVSAMRASATDDGVGKPAPLFKSRSRAYWARTSVVLATTDEATRRAAFMVGLSMFPPVSAA